VFGVIIFLVLALRSVDLIKHQESVEKKKPAIAQMNSLEYASRRASRKRPPTLRSVRDTTAA